MENFEKALTNVKSPLEILTLAEVNSNTIDRYEEVYNRLKDFIELSNVEKRNFEKNILECKTEIVTEIKEKINKISVKEISALKIENARQEEESRKNKTALDEKEKEFRDIKEQLDKERSKSGWAIAGEILGGIGAGVVTVIAKVNNGETFDEDGPRGGRGGCFDRNI